MAIKIINWNRPVDYISWYIFIEGVNFAIYYAPVTSIKSLQTIIVIYSTEWLINILENLQILPK